MTGKNVGNQGPWQGPWGQAGRMPHRVGVANVHKDQGYWIQPLCQLGTLRTGEDKGTQEQVAS